MDPFDEPFNNPDVLSPSSYMPPEPPCSPVFNVEANNSGSGSLNLAPESPVDAPVTSSQVLDVLHKQIANRTTALDAASAEKTKTIEEAAKKYLEAQKAERHTAVAAARSQNQKNQAAKTAQLQQHQNADALWTNVGLMLDLSKPNKFSKNTERMRSIFRAKETPTA